MIVPVLVAALCAHALLQVAPAPKHDTAIQTLPARALHDAGRLASRGPLTSLAIGGAMAALAHPEDSRIVTAFKAEGTPEESLDGGSIIGDGWIQGGAAAGVYAIGLLAHRDGAAELGSELLEAQAINGVLTQGLKYAVNRTRPNGGRYSFPSGHTSATFATADIFEQRFGWKIGVLAYAGATYVLLSRLGEHAHYPSDTLFGAAVGIASARSVVTEHRRLALKGFVVVPVVAQGGAMILLTRSR
ncbi:MAG: phosphatase PAP2 family protein [Vicinamibacterales bacterium]